MDDTAADARPGRFMFRRTTCPCRAAAMRQQETERDAELSESREQKAAAYLNRIKQNSGLAERPEWWNHAFGNYDASRSKSQRVAYQLMRQFTTDAINYGVKGLQGVVLASPFNGVGKTHLAVACVRNLLNKGFEARIYRTAALLQMARSEFDAGNTARRGEILAICQRVQLLVLDEFCKEHVASDWVREFLYELIDERLGRGLPIVITTNRANFDEFATHVGGEHGKAIQSRLAGACHWHSITDKIDGRLMLREEAANSPDGTPQQPAKRVKLL